MADAKGRIEQLAQANLKPVPANPCIAWDEMVAARMAKDDAPDQPPSIAVWPPLLALTSGRSVKVGFCSQGGRTIP
jgi:hypothetical protein